MPSSNTGPSIPPSLLTALTSIQSDLKLALAHLTALHTAHAHTATSLAHLAHLVGGSGDDHDTSLVQRLAAIQAAVDREPFVRDSRGPASPSLAPPKAYADASILASSASQGLVPASHEHACQPVRLSAATAQWLEQLLHDALLPVTSRHSSTSEVHDDAESPRAALHTAISANNVATSHEVTHPSDDAQPSHDGQGVSSKRLLGDTAQVKDHSGCVLTEDDGASRLPTPSSMTEDRGRMGSELPMPLTPLNAGVGVQTGRAGEGAVEDVDAAMDDASSKSGSNVEASLSGTPVLTRAHASHGAPPTDETPRVPHDAMASEPGPDDTYAYIRFSSPAVPCTSPPPTSSMATTPSRYATPFEAAEACVDEEAAWRALVAGLINEDGLDGDGDGERASMTPLAVDPAVLRVNGPSSQERERAAHPLIRSVSPLTSLCESDGEETTDVDHDQGEVTAIAIVPPSVSRVQVVEASSSASSDQSDGGEAAGVDRDQGEITAITISPSSVSRVAETSASASLPNASAEAHAIADPCAHALSLTETRRIVGGPTASMDELALLARRVPLRIRVKVPEGMRGAKRNWDAIGDVDAVDRIAEAGASRVRTSRVGDDVGGNATSDVPASRKRTKKVREHDRRDESKRGSKAPLQDSSPSSASVIRHQACRDARMPIRVPQEVIHSHMSSSVQSSPTKTAAHTAVVRDDSQWPALPSVFLQWDTQFIQCDNCDSWYHYGCVGIPSGDPRLEPSAVYICPTCHNQSARRQTSRLQSEICARPDCPRPQASSDADHFFVEKLAGRKKVDGYMYLWLAKWEGYPMTQATWIPRENVDGDGTKLFNAFIEAALEEGVDLARDVVLLREAVDAGWDSDAC